ncbi:MAG: M1 family metallopeptidase, partial [Candidatus Micrarchaeota archaeon]|nr:M1 family metallopeptidase [Candidatus Micrarchaeota archaeon]
SQFEAANARNAFPCFDEPEMKAVFEVSMVIDKDKECVSNMPIREAKTLDNGKKLVRFEETPKMSPYLLYLGVGNYESVEGAVDGIRIRLLATEGKKRLLLLGLDYTKKFVKFFMDYFGVRYPLPKLDLIAIPDFAAGAMENWGAMAFRESALLADANSSVAMKQRIAEVIAHELAHQWFGDLVTMRWWDDLWLNESFATFMSYKAMDRVFPEWRIDLEYLNDVVATAMAADQLLSTHPISVEVNSPAEVDQIFDAISYEKGGSILRMIENYAGRETFRKGLNRYLKEHAYSNATKYDLWKAVDSAAKSGSRIDVYGVASAWTDKKGYPIVDVSIRGNEALLRQKRFTLLSNNDKQSWPIPVSYVDSEGMREKKVRMDGKELRLRLEGDWIKLNYGQYGFYRSGYPKELLPRLGQMISEKRLDSPDAWGLESDIFALLRSGRLGVDEYTEFVDKYCFEAGYPLNYRVISHLQWLIFMLYGNERRVQKVNELAKDYSGELVEKLGWEWKGSESTSDTMLRSASIALSGIAGEETTVEKATSIFNDFVKGKVNLNNNIKGPIYSIVAWNGSRELYNEFKRRYIKENVPEEKNRLLRTLGDFSEPSIIKDALDFSLSGDVRYQDSYIIHSVVSSNPVGKSLVWKWTSENWRTLKSRFASGTHMLGRFVENMGVLSSSKEKESVEFFFNEPKNMREDLRQSLKHTVEAIEINTRFMQRL